MLNISRYFIIFHEVEQKISANSIFCDFSFILSQNPSRLKKKFQVSGFSKCFCFFFGGVGNMLIVKRSPSYLLIFFLIKLNCTFYSNFEI